MFIFTLSPAQSMELTTELIIMAISGAALAGFINTFAGNGSMITLTIMMEFIGLPATVANGTNRVGILAQAVPSSLIFYKNGKLQLRNEKMLIFFTLVGALAGVLVAVRVSNDTFRTVFSYLLIVLFLIILLKPKRWLSPKNMSENWPRPIVYLIYLALLFLRRVHTNGNGRFLLDRICLTGRKKYDECQCTKDLYYRPLYISSPCNIPIQRPSRLGNRTHFRYWPICRRNNS